MILAGQLKFIDHSLLHIFIKCGLWKKVSPLRFNEYCKPDVKMEPAFDKKIFEIVHPAIIMIKRSQLLLLLIIVQIGRSKLTNERGWAGSSVFDSFEEEEAVLSDVEVDVMVGLIGDV